MDGMIPAPFQAEVPPDGRPANLSRRDLFGASLSALVLGVALPGNARAQAAAPAVTPGTRVSAFPEIRPGGNVLLRSPFAEGGQGVFMALAQTVGEELDADPVRFTVECAPPGPDYALVPIRRWPV